jgi:hypothetical protein
VTAIVGGTLGIMSRKSHSGAVSPNSEFEAIAQMQGVKPASFDQLMCGEPIVPDDETADMVIEAVCRRRKEGTDGARSEPAQSQQAGP